MTLVVDASVALKWVLAEEGREATLDLLGETLIAPDFLILECANTLAMKVRTGQLDQATSANSLRLIAEEVQVTFWPSRPHMSAAHSLATLLGRSAYDSLYLALADAEGAVLVTADRKFADAVGRHPVFGQKVRLLQA